MGEGVLTKSLDLDRDPLELNTNTLELHLRIIQGIVHAVGGILAGPGLSFPIIVIC
jgi:hypothetical protein